MWRNMPTKTSLKRNRYEKNIWTEISSPKTFQEISLSKNISTTIYQGSSAETFSAQKLKRHLDQNVSQETFPYQKTWRKISTKKTSEEKFIPSKMKKHLHQKIWKKNHSKKHGKNQNWWNLMKKCGFYISSVSMFAIFRFKKTEVLLWRFLLYWNRYWQRFLSGWAFW